MNPAYRRGKRLFKKIVPPASWPYILSHPVVTVVGIIAVCSGLVIIGSGGKAIETSSLSQWLPPIWETFWPIFNILGGSAIIFGILTRRPQWEAMGCVFLTATFTCQCVSVITIRGFESGFVASVTLGSLALGLATRAVLLVWANNRGEVS